MGILKVGWLKNIGVFLKTWISQKHRYLYYDLEISKTSIIVSKTAAQRSFASNILNIYWCDVL